MEEEIEELNREEACSELEKKLLKFLTKKGTTRLASLAFEYAIARAKIRKISPKNYNGKEFKEIYFEEYFDLLQDSLSNLEKLQLTGTPANRIIFPTQEEIENYARKREKNY